ncbi:chemotaxis protein CheB [Larkinella knui]|uniref:PAS domain S-box protein n=1 Tax=Larkinella knui TaxID=2025310 RepID=A0A3P1CK86_9BACT|nr:chemotaxis protein CheB [Larkinella knui]RRB13752.1 PAS domain S-box protein [Larkinella knui]
MSKKPPVEPLSTDVIVPVVAIGASAGGLEAVSQLFENLSSTTGFAFVYIQHLDPNFESQIATIIGRVTAMPVREAEHEMRIERDYVYIIPPNKDIEVVDGVLTLSPRRPQPHIQMPIDQFFTSLASRQREGAIGILLSGAASDGTLGLKAIKAAGGITIVQDETAQFQSMPKTAIHEGVVDFVLPPKGIAKELERLSHQTFLFRLTALAEGPNDVQTPDEDLKAVIQFLKKSTGVDFTHYKVSTIRRRIIRRMLLYKLEHLQDYIQYLKQHTSEVDALYSDLLINVTHFFRDEETMDYLKKILLPQIIKTKTAREPLRIWIPACSTGQEAYSIAMLILEVLDDRTPGMPVHIFATDLSETAIAKARHGSYSRSEVMDISPQRLQRFFTKVDDQYRISRTIRDLCVFAPHNIFKDPPFSRLDLISCRNLLIYLDNVLQKKAIATFHYALNPTGYLLLGKSETIGSSVSFFAQLEKNYKIYVRKNDVASRPSFEMNPRLPATELMEEPNRIPPAPKSGATAPNLDSLVDSLLLSQYVPASVVVNQDLDILQFRGSTGLFLEPLPGKASLNLLKMARPSLLFELRNTVHKAHKSGESVRKTGLEIKLKNKTHQVAIEAVPLKTDTEERLFLIIFEEIIASSVPEAGLAGVRNRRIKQLEDELATLREDLHSIIEEQEANNEELQSANEEIISSNEELQSINEELETSKEEIESSNEELQTINQELQQRNDQLTEAYEFAEDIFATIREATVVLNRDLKVMSANRAFYSIFRVQEDDTEGRMFYELGNRQWDIPKLRKMLDEVLEQDAKFVGFEVSHSFPEIGEKVMYLNARKVIRQHSQEAILLAIDDITEHRQVQRMLAEQEAWFHTIVDSAPALIWVAGTDGRYNYLNTAWLGYTGRPLQAELGHGWPEGIHPDDRQNYLARFHVSFEKRQPFSSEYRLRRHDGEYRWMLEHASPIFKSDGSFNGYLGTCSDVHLQKTLNRELDLRVQERTRELHTNETLLRQREEQLRTLVENTPDNITRWDTDLRLLFANSAFETITGAPFESSVGKTLQEMGIADEIAVPYMEKLKRVFESKQPVNHYYSFPTETGEVSFYTNIVPEPDSDGIVTSVLAISRNITELVQVQRTIKETADSLQAVLNSSPASIAYFKSVPGVDSIADFQLIICNQKFANLNSKSISQMQGELASHLFPTQWQEGMFDQFKQVVETGQSIYLEQYDQSHGIDRWWGTSIIKYDGGLVMTGLDITSLKHSESQQNQLLQELNRSNDSIQALASLRQHVKDRGEFLRRASHDLRGSFGVIQGAASLLDLMDTEEERSQMLEMMQRNLQQMTVMLTELLDFARLEAGQEQVQNIAFDVADLLRDLGESLRTMGDGRGLWIQIDGPAQLPVEGDPVIVRRIAQNLLINALKYTETGGVTVHWGRDDKTRSWWLTIQDTGPGLQPNLVRLLMDYPVGNEESYGTSESLSRQNSGEGIGLSIVKRLCELVNAKLTVEIPPDNGTIFRIRFPVSESHPG